VPGAHPPPRAPAGLPGAGREDRHSLRPARQRRGLHRRGGVRPTAVPAWAGLMKPTEHVTFSFLLAQLGVQQEYGPAGTLLVVAAGTLPDLDGLTLLAGWKVYRKFHRVLGHGLPMTLAGPALLALCGTCGLGLRPFGPLWAWLQVSLLAHLFADVCF